MGNACLCLRKKWFTYLLDCCGSLSNRWMNEWGILLVANCVSLVICVAEDTFRRSSGEDLGKYYPTRPECEEDVPKSRFKHWVCSLKLSIITTLFFLLIVLLWFCHLVMACSFVHNNYCNCIFKLYLFEKKIVACTIS